MGFRGICVLAIALGVFACEVGGGSRASASFGYGSGSQPADSSSSGDSTTAAPVEEDSSSSSGSGEVEQCGDGIVDPGEECENEIGCSDDCRLTDAVDAFRVVDLDIMDPVVRAPGGCSDYTAPANLLLQQWMNSDNSEVGTPGHGLIDLGVLATFHPLRTSHPAGFIRLAPADCEIDTDICRLPEGSTANIHSYYNRTDVGCPPDSSSIAPPCMDSDPLTLELGFATFTLPLEDTVIAGTFAGDEELSGVLRGFVTEEVACDDANRIEAGIPFVGGMRIGELFAGGCGECFEADDRVVGPGGASGWWIEASFTALRAPYEGA